MSCSVITVTVLYRTCMQVPADASHIHTVPSWLPVSSTLPDVCHLPRASPVLLVIATAGGASCVRGSISKITMGYGLAKRYRFDKRRPSLEMIERIRLELSTKPDTWYVLVYRGCDYVECADGAEIYYRLLMGYSRLRPAAAPHKTSTPSKKVSKYVQH